MRFLTTNMSETGFDELPTFVKASTPFAAIIEAQPMIIVLTAPHA